VPVQQHRCDGLKYRTVKQNTVDVFLTSGTHTEMIGHGNFVIRDVIVDPSIGEDVLEGSVAFSFVVVQEKF